jgi:hypothetical protein
LSYIAQDSVSLKKRQKRKRRERGRKKGRKERRMEGRKPHKLVQLQCVNPKNINIFREMETLS